MLCVLFEKPANEILLTRLSCTWFGFFLLHFFYLSVYISDDSTFYGFRADLESSVAAWIIRSQPLFDISIAHYSNTFSITYFIRWNSMPFAIEHIINSFSAELNSIRWQNMQTISRMSEWSVFYVKFYISSDAKAIQIKIISWKCRRKSEMWSQSDCNIVIVNTFWSSGFSFAADVFCVNIVCHELLLSWYECVAYVDWITKYLIPWRLQSKQTTDAGMHQPYKVKWNLQHALKSLLIALLITALCLLSMASTWSLRCCFGWYGIMIDLAISFGCIGQRFFLNKFISFEQKFFMKSHLRIISSIS